MPYLADTNILSRLVQRDDPDHSVVRSALRAIQQRREQVCYIA